MTRKRQLLLDGVRKLVLNFKNHVRFFKDWYSFPGATAQGGSTSSTLQQVEVPVLSNTFCNWRTLYLGKITENQLCAGEVSTGGKDSCQVCFY